MTYGGDWKALYGAARDGDLEGLRRWLEEGVDPNYQHPEFGTTPLIAAAERGQLEAVRLLVEMGADPRLESEWEKCSATAAAREQGHLEVVKYLEQVTGASSRRSPS